MSFTFSNDIPAANNNPSDDQPDMLQNNISTNNILNVDHVSFNNNAGGKHKQITFNTQNPPAGAPTDPEAIAFTDRVAQNQSTKSQLYYRNEDIIYQLNPIRAMCTFTVTGAIAAFDSEWNMNTIAGNRSSITIDLDTNAVTGNEIIVLGGTSTGFYGNDNNVKLFNWTFANPTLTLTPPKESAGSSNTQFPNNTKFSLLILQV